MNIDVTALRGLVREKDVSFDTVVEAGVSDRLLGGKHLAKSGELIQRRSPRVSPQCWRTGPRADPTRH